MTPTNQNSNSMPNLLQAGIKSPLRKRLYIYIQIYYIANSVYNKGEIFVLVQISYCGLVDAVLAFSTLLMTRPGSKGTDRQQ